MTREPIYLEVPLSKGDVEPLRAGYVVRLSDLLSTARDVAHTRMAAVIENGEPLPFDPEEQVDVNDLYGGDLYLEGREGRRRKAGEG